MGTILDTGKEFLGAVLSGEQSDKFASIRVESEDGSSSVTKPATVSWSLSSGVLTITCQAEFLTTDMTFSATKSFLVSDLGNKISEGVVSIESETSATVVHREIF